MANAANEILPVNVEDELKSAYLDYAMSVIVGRALPDVRDGLKPVHRRVAYAMHELGNDWNKPHKKSARIVGEVIGKYHPHGDVAVYDTIVRMAQPFSMRYVLVDGQGNFGSIDGDSAAAMRYTEIRLSRLAHSLMADIDKETVDFAPNYDETEFSPVVMPTRIPNLLVNGSSGIAVGMATNIPPHNIGEVIDACLALIDDSTLDADALMQYIPGPDFPTAGIIHGRQGLVNAYRTGRGRAVIRARTHIETNEKSSKQQIVATELPYQVNKARLIEKIAELVKEKKIEGISGLRDESDKDGIRVVIEIKRGENPEVILNQLYLQTQLQHVFGINIVALVDGQPRTLALKEILECFIRHRKEVVTRRTVFEYKKAKARAHILEGLSVALVNIDDIIATIKHAPTSAEAKEALQAKPWQSGKVNALLSRADMAIHTRPDGLAEDRGLKDNGYYLSADQAQAILDLRLHRLTGLEQDKIGEEYQAILDAISGFLRILSDRTVLMNLIKDELREIKAQFNDPRRTEIVSSSHEFDEADLIAPEDVVVTLSYDGYVKYQPVSVYSAQRRGGKGKAAASVKTEDAIHKLVVANTHDTLLCFSSIGKVYWLKVYHLPQASRISRGKPIINLLALTENERITTILPITEFSDTHFVVMATAQGVVKKVTLSEFSRPRNSGIIAVDLDEGDELIGADLTNGQQEIMLFTDEGKVIRFNEEAVRAMGRTARGVRGVRLQDNQSVKSLVVVHEGDILTATQRGFGKRTPIDDYPVKGRGGQGVISIQTSERNGNVVGAIQVLPQQEVMLITDKGTLVRIRASEVSCVGRNTQGVKLINLSDDEVLVGLERVDEPEEIEGDDIEGDDNVVPFPNNEPVVE